MRASGAEKREKYLIEAAALHFATIYTERDADPILRRSVYRKINAIKRDL